MLTGFSGQNVVRTCKWIPRHLLQTISSLIHLFFGSLLPNCKHTAWLINFISYILNWDCVHKDYSVNIKKKKEISSYIWQVIVNFQVCLSGFSHSRSIQGLNYSISLVWSLSMWYEFNEYFEGCLCLLCNIFCDLKSELKKEAKLKLYKKGTTMSIARPKFVLRNVANFLNQNLFWFFPFPISAIKINNLTWFKFHKVFFKNKIIRKEEKNWR